MSGFVHLHLHSGYSLLDGACRINEIAEAAAREGQCAVALTDHGAMYGAVEFYRACKAAEVKPIIGCEVYVAPKSRFDRDPAAKYNHLVLLVENEIGYRNLCRMVSLSFTEGFYSKPRVDYELLTEYSEGLIALSGCLGGIVPSMILASDFDGALREAERLRDIFGKDSFYLELQDHGMPEQKKVNRALLEISGRSGIPLVATNDVHYIRRSDAGAQRVLMAIAMQSTADEVGFGGEEHYFKSEAEMASLFPYAPQAIENTQKIADRCNVEIEFGVTKLPKFDVPEGYTSWEYLNKLCYDGLEERYHPATDELKARLKYELDTIKTMGYVDYFLIVWDFIKFARDHDIMVGPGRGSAAGSIVSYTLGITQLDPMRYQLLFERFLNPERVTMPDIDVDFCFERRPEVIDYVTRKYGKDRVVQIVTFGTLAARGVIRDVGRVLDMPYAQVDSIAKMIPNELNITIDKALQMNHELRELYQGNEEVAHLIDMSRRLEGLPRHTSMHAAGVVIGSRPLVEFVPLSRGSDGTIVTQFTMTTLEELGLLKMDFLGLRNATKLAERYSNKKIDLLHIDYNDPKVLGMIGASKTVGVFQLESAGMKNFMKELKPQSLEDIIAGISLYRPGPMDFIPQYIKGKNNPESVTYDTPLLKPILEPTYGCIVYQEQVMQIVQALAGYSLGRADLVRRAMSKKKASVMEKERQNFVYGNEAEGVPGCIKNGIDEKTANKIYDEMIDFAKYAFNKSHAAAYAFVSYQTAWLKYYYPVEFMAALMTSCIDNPGKVAEYILSSRQMGISILPPDINRSEGKFTVDGQAIRYGMAAVKGIGKPVMEAIVEERSANGPFRSLKDFAERLSGKEVNKRTVENFIKAGAFDCFGVTRKQLMFVYANVLDDVAREKKDSLSGQMSLFDFVDETTKRSYETVYPDVGEYEKSDLLALEKEVLGIYVSGHPLEEQEECWRKNISAVTTDFQPDEETGFPSVTDGAKEIVGGIITDKKIKYTKNNKTMAFLTLEDLVGSMEIVVFPRDYEKNAPMMQTDARVFIQGRVSAEDDKPSKLICEKIFPFAGIPKELWIQFPDKETYEREVADLYQMLHESDGKDSVILYIKSIKAMKKLPPSRNVQADARLVASLQAKFGTGNVKVVEKSIEKRA